MPCAAVKLSSYSEPLFLVLSNSSGEKGKDKAISVTGRGGP
jgi:hypothetical protein